MGVSKVEAMVAPMITARTAKAILSYLRCTAFKRRQRNIIMVNKLLSI